MLRKILSITMFISFFCQQGVCQNKKIIPLIEHYFRATPFEKDFADLINFYSTDPDFVIDSTSQRSDTSVFYLRGYHKTFNPFSFPVNRLVFTIRQNDDSLNMLPGQKEVYFLLSVSGFIDSSEKSIQLLKGELKTIKEKLEPFYGEPSYIQSTEKSVYPLEYYFFRQFTAGWTYLPYYQKSLYITLRLLFVVDVKKNTKQALR